MKEPKTIAKSIRMTETVYDYVNAHVGEGFNQKFENLCIRLMFEESGLDRRIAEKRELLESLQKKIRTIQNGLKAAEDISQQLKRAKSELRKMAEECNSFAPGCGGAAG